MSVNCGSDGMCPNNGFRHASGTRCMTDHNWIMLSFFESFLVRVWLHSCCGEEMIQLCNLKSSYVRVGSEAFTINSF